MNTFERKIEILDRVEIVELNDCMAVNSDIKSQLRNEEFFVSKKDAKDWNKDPYKLNTVAKKYLYFNDEFWNLANKVGLSNNKLWDLFPGCIVRPMDAIKLSDFSEDKVIWFDTSSHLLYNIDAKNPISMPYRMDYIGGLTNDCYDLKKAQKVLSENPNVIWISSSAIPRYNAERGRDAALEFIVRLPQETHDMLCEYYRDVVKAPFWTVRVKEAIVWRPWLDNNHGYNLDVLGLKECYVEKENKDHQEEEY